MYYLFTSCLVFFFIFSLFHLLPCASSKEERGKCELQFQCGNITAGFPFWGEERHNYCGHPLLELHCSENITSIIISDYFHHVLHIDQTSNTLRLFRPDVLGSVCSSTFSKPTLPSEIFELSTTYKSVTFYNCPSYLPYLLSYPCPGNDQMLVSVNPAYPASCHASFTVNVPMSFNTKEQKMTRTNLESLLEQGFEVKLKIDVKACQECFSSHSSCGFNESSPFEVNCGPLRPPTGKVSYSVSLTAYNEVEVSTPNKPKDMQYEHGDEN